MKFILKMMNDLMQIQNMKIQMKNAEMQLDNLEMQMKNLGSLNIGMQINNMGIQLLNMGIQMINIGMNMPNNQNDMFNFNQNIQNILNQLQNIGMPNQQMGIPMGMNMPPFGMNNPMNNNNFMGGFDDIMEPQMNNDRFNDPMMEPENKKINIVFETLSGKKNNLVVDYGTTIDNLLQRYLNILDRPPNQVEFILNGDRLELGDETKVEKYFNVNITGIPRVKVLLN